MANHWSQFPELRTKYLVDLLKQFAMVNHSKPMEAAVVAFAFATNKTTDWRYKDAPELDRRTRA